MARGAPLLTICVGQDEVERLLGAGGLFCPECGGVLGTGDSLPGRSRGVTSRHIARQTTLAVAGAWPTQLWQARQALVRH